MSENEEMVTAAADRAGPAATGVPGVPGVPLDAAVIPDGANIIEIEILGSPNPNEGMMQV